MISSGSSNKTFDDVQAIPPEVLASYYLGVNDLPAKINAPYRSDAHPSLYLFIGNNGKLMYSDFARNMTGDIIDLMSKIWCTDAVHTKERIVKDIPNFESKGYVCRTLTTKHHKSNRKVSTNLAIKVRQWKPYDFEFWEQYGISKAWLEFGDIVPISHFFLDNTPIKADQYAYAYIERKDGVVTYKIYQPKSERYKWINSHNSSVWDLWTKIPQSGDKLIITSSRKDALCLWENTGIPAVSLQGEGYVPKEKVIEELKSRFKEIYVFYDNDFDKEENHGRIFAESLCDKFKLSKIEIPDYYQSKDPSDLCKNYGRYTVYTLVNSLININYTGELDDLPF